MTKKANRSTSDDRFNYSAQLKLVTTAKRMVPKTSIVGKPRDCSIVVRERPKDEEYFISATS